MTTSHGSFETPAFMPVGTQGTVKTLTPRNLQEIGTEVLLANAYHLYIRPGIHIISQAGGLHRYMAWKGPLLTDSGGYQIFSLAKLREVRDEGVVFQSLFDGRETFLSPELTVAAQEALGSDIAMVLDECPPYTENKTAVRKSVQRTLLWARRARACHRREGQALFGIIQGGVFLDLRRESLERTLEIGFEGYALGGLSVDEPKEKRAEVLAGITPRMLADQVRYLMGVGYPSDILEAVACGIDLFDCVIPTRYGRNGTAFTRYGPLVVRNGQYAEDLHSLEEDCPCYTCQNFSRSYLRHLFNAREILGAHLVSYHNVYFFLDLMKKIRESIREERFSEFRHSFESLYDERLR